MRIYETVVELVSDQARAGPSPSERGSTSADFQPGKKVPAEELRELRIERDNSHGNWNDLTRP